MKFQVPEMSCNHCVASVTKAIESLSKDAEVVCDLGQRTVEVTNIDFMSPQSVIDALDDIGYDAKLMQAKA